MSFPLLSPAGEKNVAEKTALEKRVENLVQIHLDSLWSGEEVNWVISSPWRLGNVPEEATLSIESDFQPRGSTVLLLVVKEGNRLLQRLPLSVRIEVKALVPVINCDCHRRTTVDSRMINWERRDVTRLAGDWAKSDMDLNTTTWWMKRSLRTGDILTWDYLEPKPIIQNGDRIRAIVRHGTVTVSTTGIALESAYPGDSIQIRNASSGAVLYGIVQPDSTVLISGVINDKGTGR